MPCISNQVFTITFSLYGAILAARLLMLFLPSASTLLTLTLTPTQQRDHKTFIHSFLPSLLPPSFQHHLIFSSLLFLPFISKQ